MELTTAIIIQRVILSILLTGLLVIGVYMTAEWIKMIRRIK